MDLITTISTITSGLEIVKLLRKIDSDFDNAEFKAKMAGLYGNLADTKMAIIDANERIMELEKALTLRDHTKLVNGIPYQIDENGEKTDIYYCPNCFHGNKFVEMIRVFRPGVMAECPVCEFERKLRS